MEMQINEIMRSLGRIEQKSDSAISSLGEIKETLKDHTKEISDLKTYQDTQKGETKISAIVWGMVSSVVVSGVSLLLFKNN